MQQAYAYDYLFRLQNYRAFSNGQLTDCADYKYDALDRQVWEGETHGTGVSCSDSKTTQFSYEGLTNNTTQEQQSSSGTLQTTKDYSYDAFDHRTSESVTPAGQSSTTYTYGYNVHASVSLLLDPSGNTKASYGYRPYGDQDSALSGGDTDKNNPFNPYRYTGKRFDSGSQTLDTGARRFNTSTSKFLQPDQFNNALANLNLGSDPLTQNRYSMAGGNPISGIELDGHVAMFVDGGGNADPSASPAQYQQTQQTGNAQRQNESKPQAWNPFTWNWSAGAKAFQQGTSHYEGATAEQTAEGVAGDLDLYDFGALGALDQSMGGHLSESRFYKEGQQIGTPFAIATAVVGGVGLIRGGYAAYRAASAAHAVPQGLTTVYRVESAINARLSISEGGDVSVQGTKALFLNFGSEARANSLLARRLAQGNLTRRSNRSTFRVRTSTVCASRRCRRVWPVSSRTAHLLWM